MVEHTVSNHPRTPQGIEKGHCLSSVYGIHKMDDVTEYKGSSQGKGDVHAAITKKHLKHHPSSQ